MQSRQTVRSKKKGTEKYDLIVRFFQYRSFRPSIAIKMSSNARNANAHSPPARDTGKKKEASNNRLRSFVKVLLLLARPVLYWTVRGGYGMLAITRKSYRSMKSACRLTAARCRGSIDRGPGRRQALDHPTSVWYGM